MAYHDCKQNPQRSCKLTPEKLLEFAPDGVVDSSTFSEIYRYKEVRGIFENFTFSKIKFNMNEFRDGIFKNCHFEDVLFKDPSIYKLDFIDSTFVSVIFQDSLGLQNVNWRDLDVSEVTRIAFPDYVKKPVA